MARTTKNQLDLTTSLAMVLIVAVALFITGIQLDQIAALIMGIMLIGFVVYSIYKQQQRR